MEPDRFNNNHKLYILGIICLVACISLFFFSMYIAPFLLWQLNYDVPDLVTSLITLFNEEYELSLTASRVLTWFVFFIPCIITGLISYYISNRIEDKIYHFDSEVSEEDKKTHSFDVQKQIKESASIVFKIVLLMIVIVVIILFLQLLIQI